MDMEATTKTNNKFQTGETYYCRSAVNSDSIFVYTVIKRTAKRITVDIDGLGVKTVGVKTDDDGAEWALPEGRYSMCPVIRADRRYEANIG